ncbi:hypothetical protein MACK_000994 [Theileria orientalis]|uniref:Uncharacterized protein n=1 Tax=Theileria orientalis TaxID=68886 RepID=A0A976MCL5_THEOR|nr:hypothetical protein MACK_000994 [Theileria orientalis]
MLDELPCVWNGLFSESGDYSFGYNEKLLTTSIAHEYSNTHSNRDVLNNNNNKIYSLKRVLQLILEGNDSEITNEALESLFKLREELLATFSEVAHEQNFEELLSESIKLIIVDAFNRKVKDGNKDYSPSMADVSSVKNIERFLKVVSEINTLLNDIKQTNRQIAYTMNKIEEVLNLIYLHIKTHIG